MTKQSLATCDDLNLGDSSLAIELLGIFGAMDCNGALNDPSIATELLQPSRHENRSSVIPWAMIPVAM